VQVPVNRVACLSSLYTGCLEKLNLRNKLVAVDNADFICDSVVLKKVDKGEIKEISKGSGSMNVEQALLINPELIITYGMGNPEKDMNQKITQAGIPVAISVEHLETSPLAGAEWIKFIACFFNEEKQADSIFKDIAKRYMDLKNLTANLTAKPSVLTEMKYGDTWFVPGGKSFMAQLLNDAGANYLWKDNDKSGSLQLNFEEVYNKAINTDYWLNLLLCKSKKDIAAQDKRYTELKAFKTGQLYNNNAFVNNKGGNAYWETGLMSPDEVLADMIFIFHPELLPGHQLKYYKKLL
jgi:iron complex transport system substrate-binding protein